MKKWLKVLLIVLAVVVGLLAIIAFVGSPIAKVVVRKHAPDWVGREVEVSRIWINPLMGSVTINDFALKEQNGDSVFVKFDELYVRCALPKLMAKKVHLRHIWLTDFGVKIEQNDTAFNFTDIVERFMKQESDSVSADTTSTSSSWQIMLDDIRLHGGRIGYADLPKDRAWNIENINLDIPGLHFGNRQTDAGLSLSLPDGGGDLRLRGAYNMARGAYALIVDMKNINLNQALPVVQDYVNVKDLEALLSGHLKANGRLDDAMNIQVQGNVALDGVDVIDEGKDHVLSVNHIGVQISELNPKTMVVRIDTVEVDSLHVNYVRAKNYDTLSRLLGTEYETDDTAENADETNDLMAQAEALEEDSTVNLPQPKTKMPDVKIQQFVVKNSGVHYEDKTLPSRFKYDITSLRIRANNLDLNGKQNHLIINANLPHGGSVMANMRGGLDIDRDNVKLVAMVRNMQLTDISPYMEYMFAYPVKSGTLSMTSDNSLRAGKLDGTTNIDILNMTLGKKQRRVDAQLKRVPLKSAIELLTDMNGKILLSVPIVGDINNPKFKLRKVIMGTIGNVLLKATAAPFVALARQKNLSVGDLTQLEVDLLVPDFTLEQYRKVDVIAELLQEKSELELKMQQQFNMDKAVQKLAVFNLKKEYYWQTNPPVDARQPLSIIEIEKIKKIKESDAGFQQYAKQYLPDGKGKLQDKAVEYYTSDSLMTDVLKLSDWRNRLLMRYLTEQKGIDKSRIQITTVSLETLLGYKDNEKYSIEAIQKD